MITPNQAVSDPELFAKKFLKILDKNKELVPLVWNKAQKHFHEHRTGRDLILKARQLGMSTYVQAEMYRRTVTQTRTTITLAHDADTTAKLRLMADRFHEHCRFGTAQPARKYANASLTTYPEFDSTATISTAGNIQTGRGDTYTDLHGSEVAFWPDAEKIVAGAMQGGNPDVVLESTPNGSQGYFYERCIEAMRGEGVWTLHFYPWWWDVAYTVDGEPITRAADELKLTHLTDGQIRWRRLKQRELGRLFAQEYPEDPISCFLTSGNSYFGDIAHCFTAPNDAVYNPEHRYSAGLDFGQTNDYTVLYIKDITANCVVDKMRIRKLEWAEQRRRIKEFYLRWHLNSILAEANSIGSVNIEAMRRDGMNITPFNTTNQSKADIMSDLYEALHTGGMRLQDDPVLRHEMNTFISSQTSSGVWRLAAEGEGHDDCVMALALANATSWEFEILFGA